MRITAGCPRTSIGPRSAIRAPRPPSIWALRTLEALSQRLLAQGIDPFTPAVLVERATCADERSIFGTIADLPAKAAAAAPSGPCLVLIGRAFDRAAEATDAEKAAMIGAMTA